MRMSDRMYPHMFVHAGSRFAEILCDVEFFDTLSIGRARELAENHDGHLVDECAVLRAAQACLRAGSAVAYQCGGWRKRLCQKGFGVSYSGASEFSGHDCGEDPGPICSVLIAVAMAGLTRGCDPRECRMRERVAEAFAEFGIAEPRPPRLCVEGANALRAGRIPGSVMDAAVVGRCPSCIAASIPARCPGLWDESWAISTTAAMCGGVARNSVRGRRLHPVRPRSRWPSAGWSGGRSRRRQRGSALRIPVCCGPKPPCAQAKPVRARR